MTWLGAHWAHALEAAGLLLEVIGVLLMANAYTRVFYYQLPGVLVSSLWNGKAAKDAAEIKEHIHDNAVVSIRGLAFMCLGFMLKATPSIVHLIY